MGTRINMQSPSTPDNEAHRLATLKSLNILDTEAEERFDRITRMARKLFQVPIALVSLVDENRQWFKSCFGIDATETPRDISFCGHAILGNEVFNIPDASQDTRFADNPLVTGAPNVRFYAGRPLKAPNGDKIGTLCIIDQEPRNLDDEDLIILDDLAAMVEQELSAVQQASIDELTQISNRRGFHQIAEHSLQVCKRQNIPACLAFFDLDSFKPINDQFGHKEGDNALRFFAEQLQLAFRETDLVARIGGDEFTVFFINTSTDLANAFVERFTSQLEEATQTDKRPYKISFSYGLVDYDSKRHHSINELMIAADKIMYQHKQEKNQRKHLSSL